MKTGKFLKEGGDSDMMPVLRILIILVFALFGLFIGQAYRAVPEGAGIGLLCGVLVLLLERLFRPVAVGTGCS